MPNLKIDQHRERGERLYGDKKSRRRMMILISKGPYMVHVPIND